MYLGKVKNMLDIDPDIPELLAFTHSEAYILFIKPIALADMLKKYRVNLGNTDDVLEFILKIMTTKLKDINISEDMIVANIKFFYLMANVMNLIIKVINNIKLTYKGDPVHFKTSDPYVLRISELTELAFVFNLEATIKYNFEFLISKKFDTQLNYNDKVTISIVPKYWPAVSTPPIQTCELSLDSIDSTIINDMLNKI